MENNNISKEMLPIERKDDKKKKDFTPIESRLRAIVAAKGMTLAGLAKNIGVDPASIQSFMKRDCSLSTLYLIANGLGVQVADLFDVPTDYERFEITSQQNVRKAEPVQQRELEVQTTAFCPHCGAKVRVGVVLMPE